MRSRRCNRAPSIAREILTMEENFSDELEEELECWNSLCVYNPLIYAAAPHENYINTYLNRSKRVLFLGMNPGPYGMAQNGVPFGDTYYVTNFLGISGEITPPTDQHPKKPILGFDCPKREVSGRRFWGLVESNYETPKNFSKNCAVINFCPLLFLDRPTGENVALNKLPSRQRQQLEEICSDYLLQYIDIMNIEEVVAIGKYAERKAKRALRKADDIPVHYLLHPSPASPQANRGWDAVAQQQLAQCGVLPPRQW